MSLCVSMILFPLTEIKVKTTRKRRIKKVENLITKTVEKAGRIKIDTRGQFTVSISVSSELLASPPSNSINMFRTIESLFISLHSYSVVSKMYHFSIT